MANTITGRIYKIMPTKPIVSEKTGNTFHKREIVLDASRFDQYTGEKKYDNYPMLEFGGEEQCAQLDKFKEGELVTVSFDLNGTQYQDRQTNETKYFTRVRAYKIERVGTQAQQPQAQVTQPQPEAAEARKERQGDSDLPF